MSTPNGGAPDAARGPYQLLPPLDPESLAQLESSIAAHGVEEPIWVDEQDRTLDGHHRRAIADRLGIAYEKRVAEGLSEEGKTLFAIRKNTERRQLTKAQRALVAMRAEPAFRVEAKTRQGKRSDLSPKPAKGERAEQRRVWAAEEASRLVGLPLSTYKHYRELIADARKERPDGEVDRAIDAGRWDVPEIKRLAEMWRGKEEARAQKEQARAQVAGREQHAAALWKENRERQRQAEIERAERLAATRHEDWVCADCDTWWPSSAPQCGVCGKPRRIDLSDPEVRQATAQRPWLIAEPTPVVDPAPEPEADPQPVEPTPDPPRFVPQVLQLGWKDVNALESFRAEEHEWSLIGKNPWELAPIVVAELNPAEVARIRQGVRRYRGWLAAFDDALQQACLGIVPAEHGADGA